MSEYDDICNSVADQCFKDFGRDMQELKNEIESVKNINKSLSIIVDKLEEEIEAYKLKEKICSDCECHPEYLRWKRENNQLKEALKKCSPFHIVGSDTSDIICTFCYSCVKHKPNCEYIKLIGGERE